MQQPLNRMAPRYGDERSVARIDGSPWRLTSAPAAITACFTAFFDQVGQDQFEPTWEGIQVAGAWAFARGTVRWRGVPRAGGDPVGDDGKYLVILRRQADGSWKVARDIDDSDRPLAQSTGGTGWRALEAVNGTGVPGLPRPHCEPGWLLPRGP